jgi:CO/xanthine dehydrogenase Mo-binding subunit
MTESLVGTGKAVGAPVRRVEDPRVLLGKSQYVDDIHLSGTLGVAFVHSPYAHARVLKVDVEAAQAHSGVEAVLTGVDVADAILPLRVEYDPAIAPPAAIANAVADALAPFGVRVNEIPLTPERVLTLIDQGCNGA